MTRPTPSSRSTRTPRWSRAACRATRAAGCSSDSSSRTAPARYGSGGNAARGWGLRACSPRQRLVYDALNECVVLETRFLRRFRHFVFGRNERVGVHLEHVHLVVVRQSHVNAAVILQPERVKCGATELADAACQLVGNAFGEHILDSLFLAVILVPFRLVRRDAVLADLRLTERHLRQRQNLQIGVADQTHVHLASFDHPPTNPPWWVFVLVEPAPLGRGQSVSTHGAWANPDDP